MESLVVGPCFFVKIPLLHWDLVSHFMLASLCTEVLAAEVLQHTQVMSPKP